MPPKDGDKFPFLTRKMLAFEQATAFGLNLSLNGRLGQTVAIRGFTKEGTFNLKIPVVADGVPQTNTFKIPDIPIFISVVDALANASQGDCYVELRLTVNDVTAYALCSGWVYKNKSVSYPQTASPDSTPNRGRFSFETPPADPAVGTQFSYTLPTGWRYRIIDIVFALQTSATVANRRMMCGFTVSGNDHFYMYSQIDQVASLTRQYRGAIQKAQSAAIGTSIGFEIPQDLWITGGDVFFTNVQNLQAGDELMTLEILVEKFIIS